MMEGLLSFCFVFIDLLVLYDLILLVEVPFGIPMKSNLKQLAILGLLFIGYYALFCYVIALPKVVIALFEYLFYAVAIVICAKEKRFKALLLSIPAVLVYMQWGMNFELVEVLFGWNKFGIMIDDVFVTPLWIASDLSFFVVLVLIKYFVGKKSVQVTLSLWEGIILVVFCVFGSYSSKILVMLQETFNDRALNIAWVLFVLLLNAALVYAIAYRKRAKHFQVISENYKQQFDAEYAYFKEYKKENKEISKFRHDWKNHMIVMQGLLEQGNVEEAKAYFDELSGGAETSKWKVATGNETLDMILASKLVMMQEKGIEFDFAGSLTGISYMKPADLCIVFSNLIDNAIEATEKCAKKQIFIKVTHSSEYCLCVIENTVRQKVVADEKGLLFTTKDDVQNHGIGLQNVKEILEKYSYESEFESDERFFRVKILFKKA